MKNRNAKNSRTTLFFILFVDVDLLRNYALEATIHPYHPV